MVSESRGKETASHALFFGGTCGEGCRQDSSGRTRSQWYRDQAIQIEPYTVQNVSKLHIYLFINYLIVYFQFGKDLMTNNIV